MFLKKKKKKKKKKSQNKTVELEFYKLEFCEGLDNLIIEIKYVK